MGRIVGPAPLTLSAYVVQLADGTLYVSSSVHPLPDDSPSKPQYKHSTKKPLGAVWVFVQVLSAYVVQLADGTLYVSSSVHPLPDDSPSKPKYKHSTKNPLGAVGVFLPVPIEGGEICPTPRTTDDAYLVWILAAMAGIILLWAGLKAASRPCLRAIGLWLILVPLPCLSK